MNGKKANVAPVQKKKETKRVWKIIGQSLYSLFVATFLNVSFITKCLPFYWEHFNLFKSRFRPGDSCTNQLLAITHKIYKSFDEGFDVKWVFLDLSLEDFQCMVWRYTFQTK